MCIIDRLHERITHAFFHVAFLLQYFCGLYFSSLYSQVYDGSIGLKHNSSNKLTSQIDNVTPFGILEEDNLNELEAVEAVCLNNRHNKLLLKIQILWQNSHVIRVILYQLLGCLG